MSDFLKYGDLIMLYQGSQTYSNGKHREQKEGHDSLIEPYGGVLSSLGFVDNGVYMQQLPKPANEDSFKLGADINMFGLRTCVFTVTPKLNYDFHKDFKKTMGYYKSLDMALNTSISKEKNMLKDQLKMKLTKLEERMKKEEQLNFSIVKENIGKIIQFGAEVQIMHYDSNSFIRVTNDCSQTESIGYLCELSDFYSAGMVFKVFPKYRSRQDGDAIQLRDNIIFHSVRHKGYLSLSKELPIFADIKNPPNRNPFLVHTSTNDNRMNRYRMFLSQDNETSFQVVLFRNFYQDSNLYLMGGDIVRLTHTEIQADLTASICHNALKESHPEVYFRTYEGEFKEESCSLNSYWVVENQSFEKAGEKFEVLNTMSYSSRHAACVRLRNLMTGQVLLKKKVEGTADYELQLASKEKEVENFITFDLEPVVKNCDHLINSQIYFITETQSKAFLKQDKEKKLVRNNDMLMEVFAKRQPHTPPSEFFYPLEDQDLNETKFVAKLNKEFSSEDAYIVQKISEGEKREIFFLRSSVPLLKYLCKVFSEMKSAEKIDHDIYKMIYQACQKIIAFLFDKDTSNEIDYFEIEEMPSTRKQKLLKDIGFIDALIEIIYLPFASRLYSLQTLDMSQPFAKMLEISYTTLRYGIKEYRPNELYASQWLPLLIYQSLETTIDRDIKAGQTLTELIDNNQKILESRIELSTINRFITILKENDKDAKYVEILRAICICDAKPMIKNQKDISKKLLDNIEDKEKLIFGILNDTMQGIVLSLRVEDYKEIALTELGKESKEKDGEKMYVYVISMVRLLSDLCKDRNYLTIDVLQREFTYDICFEVISNKQYGYKERQAFTNLMINLWVDVSPLQRINLPLCVKVWDNANQGDPLKLNDQSLVLQHKKLINFIFHHLSEMKTNAKDQGDEKNEDKCIFDLSILDLTE